MGGVINQAMLLAAGLGTRMRPLTDNMPKPLLDVNGRSMLNRAIDKLVAAGVTRAAVNTHYLGQKVVEHLAGRNDVEITFFHEDEILDTGGGVKNALPFFGDQPFYCINTDLVWTDGPADPALVRLAKAWDDTAMDALMMMVPTDKAVGFGGKGDFDLEGDSVGRLTNPGWMAETTKKSRDYVWVAAQIMHPRAFEGIEAKAFSNRVPWEKALEKGHLWGQVHDGGGFHAGTPGDLDDVNRLIAAIEAG